MLSLLRGSLAKVCLIVLLGIPPTQAQNVPDILVSNRTRNSVIRFDGDTGERVGTFVAPGAGGLDQPQEVRYASDGHLLVNGFNNTEVFKYDGETGEFIGAFTSGYALKNPSKMTFGPDGHLYVSQWGGAGSKHKVARFDGESGVFIDEFTSIAMDRAMGHTWDENGILYVAGYGDGHVSRFDTDGTFIDVFTSRSVLSPVNVWFGTDSDLFVQSWGGGQVERFNGATGEYLGAFARNLFRTEGYGFYDGMLYLCDWGSGLVKRYDAETGEEVDTFIDDFILRNPNSLLFMSESTVSNEEASAPNSVILEQNYPNPVADAAEISYVLNAGTHIALKIFDLLGREVAILADGYRPAGTHTATFERGSLPSGLYIYQLTAGTHTESRRLTLGR